MACKELEHYGEYDYLVVNDNLEPGLRRAARHLRRGALRRARGERRGAGPAGRGGSPGTGPPAGDGDHRRHLRIGSPATTPPRTSTCIRRSYVYAAESHAGPAAPLGRPVLRPPRGRRRDHRRPATSTCRRLRGLLHDFVEDTSATTEDIRRSSARRSRSSSTASPSSARSPGPRARSARPRTSARCSSRWRATSACCSSSSATASTTCGRSST